MKMLVIQMVILFKSLPLWGHYTTLQLFTITNQEQLLHNGLQTLKKSVVVEIRTVLNKFLSPCRELPIVLNKFLSPFREVPKALKKFISSNREVSKAVKKFMSPCQEILNGIKKVFSPSQETLDGIKKIEPLSGSPDRYCTRCHFVSFKLFKIRIT